MGDTIADDDEDFWQPVTPMNAPTKPKGGGENSDGGAEGGIDEDEDDDDSDGLDALNDLIGKK